MAHYTLIARINAGDGKFPFVNVQFSKNHRPIPIERATHRSAIEPNRESAPSAQKIEPLSARSQVHEHTQAEVHSISR